MILAIYTWLLYCVLCAVVIILSINIQQQRIIQYNNHALISNETMKDHTFRQSTSHDANLLQSMFVQGSVEKPRVICIQHNT